MKRLISVLLILCVIMSAGCIAFAEDAAEDSDTADEIDSVLDTSEEQEKTAKLGIPTVSSVEELKKAADDLYAAGDYRNAAAAYAVYAEQANWLANIISGGLEPFYGASYDNRKNWSPKVLSYSTLTAAERKANEYKGERNRAMLYEGLCYYNLNEYETALPLLLKALDLIEIKDETNWKLGMEALYAIIEYGQ